MTSGRWQFALLGIAACILCMLPLSCQPTEVPPAPQEETKPDTGAEELPEDLPPEDGLAE